MPDDAPLSPQQRFGPAPPPSYRPARATQPGLDPTTRGMMVGAGCIIALLLLLVAGWAITGRHGGAVPLIAADKQPWRVKPANPGGMQVAGAYEVEDLPGQPAATAPTPETPSPEALRAAQPEQPPAPAQPAAAPIPSPAAPAPDTASPQPAPATVPPASPAPPATEPKLAAPAHTAPSLTSNGTFVQLAALDSEAGAHAEWQRIKSRMVDVIADRQPVFQRAERSGHTVWRIRIGGFSSIADATRFCEHVRAKGGACELATF